MKRYLRFYVTTGLLVLMACVTFMYGTANAAYPPAPPAARPAAESPARLAFGALTRPGVPFGSRPASPLTHGRLSQLVWHRVAGNFAAEFHAVAGLRRSYFIPPPNVGDTVVFTTIEFGDGTFSANSNFTATYVDVTNDWFTADKI